MTTRPRDGGMGGAVPRPVRLDRMFAPGTIAVIGASESPGLARDLLLTLRSRGYGGSVYAVNPHRRDVLGIPCYPDVVSVPAAVDLGVVLVPPEVTLEVLADCARAKVPAVAVCSSGFAEMGGEAQALQAEIGRLAREAGIRLLGPNCLGFISVPRNVPAMAIPPASIPETLHAGPVGVISQSAGLLISAMEYGSQIGVGFSLLVSTGNEEDLEAADCLEYLLDDPETRVVALILEAVRDGRRLLDLAGRARALGKAVVALKLGRSQRGAEAVRTHTAALAGAAEVFDAACREAGIETADTIAGLVDCAAFLSKRRPSARGGLAAITISGGTKALVADLAERYGVRLAELAPRTRQRLSDAIPSVAVVGNPLDVSAAAIEDEEVFGRAVEALDDDPDVGVIALVMHLKKHGGSPAHQRLVRRLIAQHGQVSKQLVVISSIPEGLSGFWHTEAAGSPVPFLNDLSALAALRGLTTATAPVAWPPPGGDVGAITLPQDLGGLADGTGILPEVEAYRLLESAGIAVAPYALVASREEAAAAADRLGYPVALKVSASGVAHKAAAGLVRLNVRSASEVSRAYDELTMSPLPQGIRRPDVLVQAMEVEGVELLLGMRVDPQFGPVVVVGLGGVWAEALRDVQVGLAPMAPERAEALISRLRVATMLRDLASRSKLDIRVLAGAVSRFSLLAVRLAPYLASLEINPLIVSARGCVAVDALGQVMLAGGRPRA
jgi:acyl-CoA synthetase (NDP forming)